MTPANSALVDVSAAKTHAKVENVKMELIHGHVHEIHLDQAEACQETYLGFLADFDR